jgi:hypothetical protein
MEKFKSINGHEKQKEINRIIIIWRARGKDFRDIQKEVLKEYGVKSSHTTLRTYYYEVLNGQAIDDAKGCILSETLKGQGGQAKEPKVISLDPKRMKELLSKYDNEKNNPIGALFAKTMALAEINIKEHELGNEPLKTSYFKTLKDLKSIM